MSNDAQTVVTGDNTSETEYLRMAVSELNESVAYLSEMVLQLQKSLAEKSLSDKANTSQASRKQNQKAPAPKKPITLH